MQRKSKTRPPGSGQPARIMEEHHLIAHLSGAGLRAMGQGSNFDAMCHRLALFGPMRPCRACGGRTEPEPVPGSGYVPANEELYQACLRQQAKAWSEQGVVFDENAYWSIYSMDMVIKDEDDDGRPCQPDHDAAALALKICESCQGIGWVPSSGWYPSAGWPEEDQLTACPTSLWREAGALLDDAAIEVSGRVARWLFAVARQDLDAALTLVVLWGPENQRGRKPPFIDVWQFTDAGAKLGRSVEKLEELRQTIALMTVPHPERNLVTQAEQQAAALVERACSAWNAVVCGCDLERPSQPPPAGEEPEGGARAAA